MEEHDRAGFDIVCDLAWCDYRRMQSKNISNIIECARTTTNFAMKNRAHEVAALYLEENADRLVKSWINWVRARVDTDTISALPARALENHIPPVLRALASYLREPVEISRQSVLHHLRLHGQVRRDQGYTLEEVLAEFDGLADVVTRGVAEALSSESVDLEPEALLETANRLATGLRSVSYIAMGTFHQSHTDRDREVASSLEELSRAIDHELRNALHLVLNGLDAMSLSDRKEGINATKIDVMRSAIKRCDYLLDTLRVMTVTEVARSGNFMVGLGDGVHKVMQELEDLAAIAGIELRVSNLPDLKVETILLYIYLINTVSNSLKYCDPEKEPRWVEISARYIEEKSDTGFCDIFVKDNGVGIPEEFVSRVCQKGFRAHPGQAQGTGLGLYLVQQGLASRGGGVTIESIEGEGTTVRGRIRCLMPDSSAITADQFEVQHLMGLSAWNNSNDGPELPPLRGGRHRERDPDEGGDS